MAFVPGFEHDVFISYSHANDHDGWISRFRELLEARLCECVGEGVTVFRDHEDLQGNDELTPAIGDAVRKAAVFIAVVSNNYVTRPWAKKECIAFVEANAKRLHRRVFVVRYDDVSPADFQKLTGEHTGYKFFDKAEGGKYDDALTTDSDAFRTAMNDLRTEIGARLKELRRDAEQVVAVTSPSRAPAVFLAEPAPGLAEAADRLMSFLKGLQYDVIRPGERFYDLENYESNFAADLRRSLVFVQLLGRKFDPHDDDRVHSWDRWQFLQAEAAGVPVFRWFNKVDKDGVEIDLQKLDADHRDFVKAEGVWDCEAPRFRELLRAELEKRYHDLRQEERPHPLIVLRTDRSDRAFAERSIGERLRQFECDWLRPPEKGFGSLEEFARECAGHGLIVVYRACPADWMLKRLQELRSFLQSEFGRRWVCGLWRDPEDDEDAFSCSVDGLFIIEPQPPELLQQFIAHLRTRVTREEPAQ